MATVLKLFWNLCLLRVGPELVPPRGWFIGAIVCAHIALHVLWLDLAMPALGLALALNAAMINLAVLASVSWFALYIRRHEERFPATLGAAAGAETLLLAVSAVAFEVTDGLVRQSVILAFTLWAVVVVGFILHRALSCKPWVGMALSLGIAFMGVVVAQAVLGSLLPAGPAAAG